MKKIIETIKSNREELISKYLEMKKEYEVLKEGMKQARLLCKEKICNDLADKKYDLRGEMMKINDVINDLTKALNRLGESTETFQG